MRYNLAAKLLVKLYKPSLGGIVVNYIIIIVTVLLSVWQLRAADSINPSGDAANDNRKTVVISADTAEPALKYRLIPLMTLDFRIIQQVCGEWLSHNGKLVYEERKNSVLVYDSEETIAKIEQFIKSADREAVNIRIDIDKIGGAIDDNSKFKIKPKKAGTVIYRNGKSVEIPDVQQITVSDRRVKNVNNVSQFIVTKSGSPAALWSGKTIIDPTWLRSQKNSPDIIIVDGNSITKIDGLDSDIKWVEVGVALMAVPRLLENGMIEVEVYPEISRVSGHGKRQTIRVESLSSRLTVQPGCRIPIGGTVSNKRSQYTNLFGPDFFKSSEAGEMMEIYLTATVLAPAKSGTKSWIPR